MLYLAAVCFCAFNGKKFGRAARHNSRATPYIVFHASMILSLELGAPERKGLKGQWGSENQ